VATELVSSGMSRRPAAWLCVLLAHVLAIWWLLQADHGSLPEGAEFTHQPIVLYPLPPEEPREHAPAAPARRRPVARAAAAHGSVSSAPAASDDETTAGAVAPRVDWSLEGEKSVKRLLERRAEKERDAATFSAPRGTWPSLTKRPPPAAGDFRWKEGIDAPIYDEEGRRIFPGDGCELKSSMTPPSLSFGCALDPPPPRGDLFDHMKEHFDEQRLPDNGHGNGTEPEARPP